MERLPYCAGCILLRRSCSWRKDFYESYKRNRQETRDAMSPREADEDKVFWEILDEFKEFIRYED